LGEGVASTTVERPGNRPMGEVEQEPIEGTNRSVPWVRVDAVKDDENYLFGQDMRWC
jgi:hypothetical protein